MELPTFFVAAVILFAVYLWFRRPNTRLPPSPRIPFPVVGHLVYMAADSRVQFAEWRQKCGDIYSLYLGRTLLVVLNGYDLISEVLVKKGNVTSDRPRFFMNEAIGMRNHGVIFSTGQVWKEHRIVSLSILKTFGMGKNILAQKIQEEVECYIKCLANLDGKPSDISIMTQLSISNIICSILIGNRFDYDDKFFQNMMKRLHSVTSDQKNVSIINFMYWLRYIPGDLFGAKRTETNTNKLMNMFMEFIDDKKREGNNSEDINNLIDAYFTERNRKVKSGEETTMDDKNLLKIIIDLFAAGTDTTATTIYWCILYILNYPETQEKVYQEIIDKVGTDRTPNMQDKPHLTYLNAVILETQRLASIVPLSITHLCSEDVSVRDFILPKGTYIVPNLDSVHLDKTTWGDDVMCFKPERFITDSGTLNIPEQLIPFGIGRRACLGEALAMMELFLYLSSMFQRFQFLSPAPGNIPGAHYTFGIVTCPKPYQVRIIERK